MVRLNFTLDADDYTAFQRDFMRTDSRIRRNRNTVTFVFPVLFIAIALLLFENPFEGRGAAMLIYTLIVSALWIAFMPTIIRRSMLKKARQVAKHPANAVHVGEREMSFSPEEITTKTGYAEERLEWGAITNLRETEKHYFLYVSTIAALIIPKRGIDKVQDDELKLLFKLKTNKND